MPLYLKTWEPYLYVLSFEETLPTAADAELNCRKAESQQTILVVSPSKEIEISDFKAAFAARSVVLCNHDYTNLSIDGRDYPITSGINGGVPDYTSACVAALAIKGNNIDGYKIHKNLANWLAGLGISTNKYKF